MYSNINMIFHPQKKNISTEKQKEKFWKTSTDKNGSIQSPVSSLLILNDLSNGQNFFLNIEEIIYHRERKEERKCV